MKLITFTVPCYNSAAYMDRCVETLLPAGEEAEIILVDDGSKDDTGKIADAYAEKYPNIVKVIHQENGGHGEGVNQGIRNASGMYFKVVDSDDWLDAEALQKVMQTLRGLAAMEQPVDLLMCNLGRGFPAVFRSLGLGSPLNHVAVMGASIYSLMERYCSRVSLAYTSGSTPLVTVMQRM